MPKKQEITFAVINIFLNNHLRGFYAHGTIE